MRELLKSLTWQELGLTSYVVMTVGALFILFFDLWLRWTGREMITDYCRANPWLAWVILALIQFGVIGLAVHFMAVVPLEE